MALHHLTSEQTVFQWSGDSPVVALVFAPKADGFLALGQDGWLQCFDLDHPHPEISATVLFGPIWYEGYKGREYVWQSTGGTDEFEPKLSLVPLIWGTAKGTLYAMLFALPLAVLAAIYTAEFAAPRVQGLVKPSVEVMASLPSVILGFLAGLWLAPLLESHLLGTLLLLPTVPVVVMAAAWVWQYAPAAWVRGLARVGEIYLLGAVTLLVAWLAYALGPLFEELAFDGHFLRWLRQDAGVGYDQRNCLVVGFAMGFAVIPLVFTICEDALSSVPSHLRAGSLALGATPWQTAIKVVLPMALPGIFSAAMIGLGRAIGETMIVLMATGNTPIMDWNIFNGNAHHLGQYRGGATRSTAPRHALPSALPQRPAAVYGHLLHQLAGRGRAPALAGQIQSTVMSFWRRGDPFIWLTGGALALCLAMIAGLVGIIVYYGRQRVLAARFDPVAPQRRPPDHGQTGGSPAHPRGCRALSGAAKGRQPRCVWTRLLLGG